jgi:hypothetical protein
MNFFVWIGEEDHMRIISMEKGDNIKNIFSRFCRATKAIQDVLQNNGHDFMHNEHLGFIAACPSNVGTGLRGGSMLKIPLFSAREDFKATCVKMGLQVRGSRGVDSGAGSGGIYDISNAARIGKSETDLLNIYIEGVGNILRWEAMLENKEDIDDEVARAEPGKAVAPADGTSGGDEKDSYPPDGLEANVQEEPEWIRLGCGNVEYICEEKGSTFSGINMPDELPDLSEHNNLMAQGLRENPECGAEG